MAGVEQREVGLDGGQQHDRVIVGEWVVDDAPVWPVPEDVGTDQPAQRDERHAFLGRLHRGIEGRTGRVLHGDRLPENGGGEARRRTELAEADRGGLQRLDAAGADQHVGLQGRGRKRHEMQALDATSDQRARRLHRHTGGFARHDDHRAVRDGGDGVVD
jgi:hypothetical protein